MISADDLVEHGDRSILAEIERLTRQIGEPYASALSDPARLIARLSREPVPPKPPADGAWFKEFIASVQGENDDGDDDASENLSGLNQRLIFPPPLSLHNYISMCHGHIQDLRDSILAKLRKGELEGFGLRHEDHAPVKIERGRWFEISLNWETSTATGKSGVTFHDVAIRRSALAPPNGVPDEDFDEGASTTPYVEEFNRWVERGKVPVTRTVSRSTLRELRAMGASRNPPLPIPSIENLRKAINRELDKMNGKI